MSDTVRVIGMRDLRRELKKLPDGSSKMLNDTNQAAAQFIVDKAEGKADELGGVHAHVFRMNSVRAGRAARGATINLGGTAAKHGPAFGAEFGSKAYGQFPAWRGNQWAPDEDNGVGYMIHPAFRENREEFLELYSEAVMNMAARAFPDD